MATLDSLDSAIAFHAEMLAQHPERDAHAALEAALAGQRRPFPVLAIGHQAWPDDAYVPTDELALPGVKMPAGPEADLAREIVGSLEPLKLLNPISAGFGTGKGPGTLAASFGVPLDPVTGDAAGSPRDLDEVLAEPPPDPETSGLLPEIRARIAFLKGHTPDAFKISRPDMQGPYNIAHAVVGEEALIAPYTAPDKFRALMTRITDFWIAVVQNANAWIGPERRRPEDQVQRICECSVNLVSADLYKEHILSHDLRIAAALHPIEIHTCSGPHVFHATLDNVPHVVSTEAGCIPKAAAGWTPVDDALTAIGDRPILLRIGQELPFGKEWEMLRTDLDRYAATPRLLFGYTGMTWRKQDRPLIRDLHRRADAYWAERYGNAPAVTASPADG